MSSESEIPVKESVPLLFVGESSFAYHLSRLQIGVAAGQ
jgi:hypothetical protein